MSPNQSRQRPLVVPFVAALAAVALLCAWAPAGAATHLTPDQEKRLVSTFNRSGEKNLKYLPGMSDQAVAKVMAHREAGREFGSTAEIRSVAGLSDEQWEALAARFGNILSDKPAAMQGKEGKETARKGNALQERMKARSGGTAERTEESAQAEGSGVLNLEVKAKYYSILPGYDLDELTDEERHAFLETINTEMCPCGCQGETLGYCLVNDPGCMVVKARVRKIFKDITGRDPQEPAKSSAP